MIQAKLPAFHLAMEIESKRDEVRVLLPRADAEALFEATDDGLKIIAALETVRILATTERASELLAAALKRRGAAVTLVLNRVEAAALEKAAETGHRVVAKFNLPREHAAAKRAISALARAIRAI